MKPIRIVLSFVALAVATTGACTPPPAVSGCEEGEPAECECSDGSMGTQECLSTGEFSECACDEPSTGGRKGSGGAKATGGEGPLGGQDGTGGTDATGGEDGTGGTDATGGQTAVGGASSGGAQPTGGGTAAGGGSATATCGNNKTELPELCDGTDLENADCTNFNFDSGTLGCLSDCSNFDTSQCNTAPTGWTCDDSLYGDGECNCGCSMPDLDCASSDVSSCESCGDGCSPFANCPGLIDPADTTECLPPACNNGFTEPGETCDGPDLDGESCATQGYDGGTLTCLGDCSGFNTSQCTGGVPPEWTCDPLYYGDGTCDCGCGVQDEDCASGYAAECQYCANAGSCSDDACPGAIDPTDNSTCDGLGVPAEWTCDPDFYGDSDCDCGCGVFDIDCLGNDIDFCEFCANDGSCSSYSCPGTIDPADIGICTDTPQVPPEWTCNPTYYGDTECDCGCGALDIDCLSADVSACQFCDNPGSCSNAQCDGLDPTNNGICVIVD